jgi:hypothetical protein
MSETNEWGTALPPKEGSEINVQFPGGTKARAKWNVQTGQTGQWEVLRHSGEWVSMRYEHGIHDPDVWWPWPQAPRAAQRLGHLVTLPHALQKSPSVRHHD